MRFGSTIRTLTPAARSASAQRRSYPPLASITARPTRFAHSHAIRSASPSGVLGAARRSPSEGMQASTLLFATSRPTTRVFSGILPLPSLLVRDLAPMQLFGLRKTPDLSLASPQVPPVVATGSDPATGGCSNNRPFADPATFSGHKVARRAGWGVGSRSGSRVLKVLQNR